MDFDGTSINHGVYNALEIWTEQSALCASQGVGFEPCRYGEKIVLSPGVLESGNTIEGVRYKRSPSMSGWWIFTEDYDGTVDNFKSMRPTHVFHVLRARRDLARFLGLPSGFAFDDSSIGTVWYEEDLLHD